MIELIPRTDAPVPPESRFILTVLTRDGFREDSRMRVAAFRTQSWHSAEQPTPEQIGPLTAHQGYDSYTIEERDGDGWNMIVNSDGSSFDGRHPGMPNRMGDAWVPARFRDARAQGQGVNAIHTGAARSEATQDEA